MNIKIDNKSAGLKIYIDDLLHVNILKIDDLIGFQSWKQGPSNFCIEFYTTNKNILTSYNSVEKWSFILKELDKSI